MAAKRVTLAQAKLLAHLWETGRPRQIGSYVEPTEKACITRGWVAPTGKKGTFPSGAACEDYFITNAALAALGEFFTLAAYSAHTKEGE